MDRDQKRRKWLSLTQKKKICSVSHVHVLNYHPYMLKSALEHQTYYISSWRIARLQAKTRQIKRNNVTMHCMQLVLEACEQTKFYKYPRYMYKVKY